MADQVLGTILICNEIRQKVVQSTSLSGEHEWMLVEEWEQGKRIYYLAWLFLQSPSIFSKKLF